MSINFTQNLIAENKIIVELLYEMKMNQLTGEQAATREEEKRKRFLYYLWINKTKIRVKVCKQRQCCLDPKNVHVQQFPLLKHHQKTTSAMSYNALLVNSPLQSLQHRNLYFRVPKHDDAAHSLNALCVTPY